MSEKITVDTETLRKSFLDAIEEIQTEALSEGNGEEVVEDDPLDKAQKVDNYMDDDDFEDENDGDDDEERVNKATITGDDEVSIDDQVLKVGKNMRVIAFMRKSSQQLDSLTEAVNALRKSTIGNIELTKRLGELVLSNAEITKSVQEDVQQIGDQPLPSTSLRKAGGGKSFTPSTPAEKTQLLSKAMKAVQEHSLDDTMIPILETRLQGGHPDPLSGEIMRPLVAHLEDK